MHARVAVVMVSTLLAVGLTTTPALADAPPNDAIENATTISATPYAAELSTRDATTADTDPSTRCFGPQNTVWWTYTPKTSGWLVANTRDSSYDTTLAVFAGEPGSLNEVACNDDRNSTSRAKLYWEASAGQTYYIMAGTCCGGGESGGRLSFTLRETVPQFYAESLIIDPVGSVDRDRNRVTISGTLACFNGPERVRLSARGIQSAGRLLITGVGFKSIKCDGIRSWTMQLRTNEGIFSAGALDVTMFAVWSAGTSNSLRTAAAIRVR